MGFSKCLNPCDHGGIHKGLITTMPSPEPFPQPPLDSSWTLLNSASLTAPWKQVTLPVPPKGMETREEISFLRACNPSAAEHAKSNSAPAHYLPHLHCPMDSSWLCQEQASRIRYNQGVWAGMQSKARALSMMSWTYPEVLPVLEMFLCVVNLQTHSSTHPTAPYPPSPARLKTNA